MLNSVILEGKVSSFPNTMSDGKVKFLLRNTIDGENMYILIQCTGEMGERVLENIRRGMTVRVVGKLVQRVWRDKYGQQGKTYEIDMNHIEYRYRERHNGEYM